MAFSKTKVTEQLLGGLKAQIYSVNFASVTEGHIKTGLKNVVAAIFVNEVSDDQGIIQRNKNSAGSADEFGGVRISSVTSNDTGTLIVIGA